jgi:uncharacterized membrane protein
MADYENGAVSSAKPANSNLTLIAHAIYGIFAFSAISAATVFGAFISIIGLVGIVLAHVYRGDAQGTWLESHYTWLIRTFWWSAIWTIVAGSVAFVFAITIIGLPIAFLIWGVFFLWVAYRLIVGWIALFREKPVK